MRPVAASLVLMGASTGAQGCFLRGSPSRMTEEVPDVMRISEVGSGISRAVEKEPFHYDAAKVMSIYTQRREGMEALKSACASERGFARCQAPQGQKGSALQLSDCLAKQSRRPVSDKCLEGIEEWKNVLAETARNGARHPGKLLERSAADDRNVFRLWDEAEDIDEEWGFDQLAFTPVEPFSELMGRNDRTSPHAPPHAREHGHGHGHPPPSRHGPPPPFGHGPRHGPHDKHSHPDHHHEHGEEGFPPPSPLQALLDWMFDEPKSSDEWGTSSSAFLVTPAEEESMSAHAMQRHVHHVPPPQQRLPLDKHEAKRARGPDLAVKERSIAMGARGRHGDPFEGGEHPAPHHHHHHHHDHPHRGDHLRYRNRLPDDFEDSEWLDERSMEWGYAFVEGALAFFFVLGAFTLLFLSFFLMSRAIRRIVRASRRSRGSSPPPAPSSSAFGGRAQRRSVSTANAEAAAADGYQALPEDSADDSDAVVVTGTPVNPPPSVHV